MTALVPDATLRVDGSPLVSIVVCSYNYAQFVAKSVDSALGQAYPVVEVIVVDDGSTDASRDVLARYRHRTQLIFKPNGGQASAWNAGFAASRGEIVLFLDADDVLATDAVSHIVDRFRQEALTKVHWPVTIIGVDDHPAGGLGRMPDEGNLREHVLVNGPFSYSWPPTSGNAWSRALLCQVLPMPEAEYRISPDLYLAALSPLFGPLGRVSHSLSAWRSHGANSSYSDPFDRRLLANVARERHCLDTLSAYCRQFGLAHDRSMWVQESWWHRIERACTSIVAAVPDEGAFVLIDEDQWGARPLISGRRVVPFTERQGEYWGPPSDSASAIAEAERHRLDGCEHVCVAWSSRWILEHYADFGTHLFDTARSVHTSDDCTIFDCRR